MGDFYNRGGGSLVLTDLEVDGTTVVVDETNNRVGIGTDSPAKTLSVDGDMHFQPTAISTAHITTAGSLDIRADQNIKIGTDGADSVRLGRVNTTAVKVHLRSGTDTDMVLFNSQLGLGTETPGTQLQLESTAPYVTLKNSTSENTAGGCESKVVFEDHSDTALGQIEVNHSGGSDDTKGKMILSTHTGSALTAALTIDDAQAATFAGAIQANGNTTFGVDDTGVDVRIYSSTASEGVLYDASEDELGLLLTTKLKFHDIGGGEEIYASSDGHLEVNAGTTLDITAPTVDINASTAVTIDSDTVTFASGNADDPLVIIKNTANDATGARLHLVKDKGGAGAADDFCGEVAFIGDDANQDQVTFGSLTTQVKVHTNGQEGGTMALSVASHDGELVKGLIIEDGDLEDEIDVTIGSGAASLTTVSGSMSVTGHVTLTKAPPEDTCSGITALFTAGEALEAGEVVYFKASDSKMWKAVATAAATSRCVAMAAADIAQDATGPFLLQGFLTNNGTFPSYTVGGVLYTPEAETTSQNVPEQTAPDTDGDFVQILGWAVTADTVYFCPDSTVIEIA